MPVTELLLEGLRLMVIGMGIVFAFLLLLVAMLRFMSSLVTRLAPELAAPSVQAPAIASRHHGEASNGELIAVISAAVRRYRDDQRNA